MNGDKSWVPTVALGVVCLVLSLVLWPELFLFFLYYLSFLDFFSYLPLSLQPSSKGLWLGLALCVVFHEAGHWMFSVLGSTPIRRVSIGVGPVLLRGRVRETTIELRLLPLAGFVIPYPPMVYRPFWYALFLLGGVLGNVALIGIATGLHAAGALADASLWGILWFQIEAVIVNLIPFRTKSGPTDGLYLLRLFRGAYSGSAGAQYAEMLAPYHSTGTLQPRWSPASSRIFYNIERADWWTSAEARRERREALMRELARGGLMPEEQMLVLEDLVTEELIFGDPALRTQLDRWSTQALELGPKIESLRVTRGWVHVELGRFEEGKAMLEPIATADKIDEQEAFDAFMTRMYLARAEYRLGNIEHARRHADATRKLAEPFAGDATVAALLARLEAELGATPSAAERIA
jgi:hypothetical protein